MFDLNRYEDFVSKQEPFKECSPVSSLFLMPYRVRLLRNIFEEEGKLNSLYWTNQSNKRDSVSIFSRGSNWQKNFYELSKDEETYSARYQFGTFNSTGNSIYILDIKEVIITVRLRHICSNKMCKKH